MEMPLPISILQRVFFLFLMLVVSGCSIHIDVSSGSSENIVDDLRGIHHVVFLKFKQVSDLEECMKDSNRMLGSIPSGRDYFCGVHVETGRETIVSDYDCAIVIGFENKVGYKEYLDHPRHLEFVEKWKPKAEWIRIYDISM